MKKFLTLALFALLAQPLSAQTTLDFQGTSFNRTTASYGGLMWTNFLTAGVNPSLTNGLLPLASGGGNYAPSASVSGASLFDLWQMDLGAMGSQWEGTLLLQGFAGANQVYARSIDLSRGWMPGPVMFNWTNIDRVEFVTAGTPRFRMDNFVYSQGAQSVVPEPATVILLGSGLLGIAGLAYRRRERETDLD